MERRGWPWKKKVTEKIALARHSTDSFVANEFNQDNELLDKAKTSDVMDARSKILNNQLAAKEELVQQHAKVAEEAVTGWEKAESEAASMKKQLEAEVQKRRATEDRISHLDGALKECMRQLRLVREEQEEKIHEAVAKNTREWERVRDELEAKLGENAKELMEAGAERAAMGKLLQERTRSIKEANEGRGRAEAELEVFQMKLEVTEKEMAKWKYEVHVVRKELEIRNEELEVNKKTADASSKQHLENVKKVAKLESECQRLRLLVRKRLPGPAAVAQMRMEVEALGTVPSIPLERGRFVSPSRRHSNPSLHLASIEPSKELTDHLLSMEQDTKSLKEALIKKTDELYAARLMCARTATKLSTVEEQLENLSGAHGLPISGRSTLGLYMTSTHMTESSQESSVISLSENGCAEDGSSCGDSCATSMVMGLAQSRKEKGRSTTETVEDSSISDLMYDFAEMEKLASMPPESHAKISGEESTKVEVLLGRTGQDNSGHLSPLETSHVAVQTHEELNSENRLLEGLRSELTRTEDELNTIKLENLAIKAALLSTEKHLLAILQFETEATNNHQK